MDAEEASKLIHNSAAHNYGNFYGGSAHRLQLGVGLIYNGIRFPLLNIDDLIYDTHVGLVYILTHECDIDSRNVRPYNDHLIVCPIISLEACVTHLSSILNTGDLKSFFHRVGRDDISRVTYLPPISEHLPNGGLIYFNQITHTHINMFDNSDADRIESVTANGLRVIDYKVANHLLRPKSESLSLIRY